jgi:hypothetical protein
VRRYSSAWDEEAEVVVAYRPEDPLTSMTSDRRAARDGGIARPAEQLPSWNTTVDALLSTISNR